MRGHLVKRSRDSWTVVIDLDPDPQTDRRRQLSQAVPGSKREAERVLVELEASGRDGAPACAARLCPRA